MAKQTFKEKLLAFKGKIDLRQENKELREEVEKRLAKWDRLLSKKDSA